MRRAYPVAIQRIVEQEKQMVSTAMSKPREHSEYRKSHPKERDHYRAVACAKCGKPLGVGPNGKAIKVGGTIQHERC